MKIKKQHFKKLRGGEYMSENKDLEVMKNFDNAYMTDEESFKTRGNMLIKKYENANQKEKEGMNKALISLCGYSFDTLMKDDYKRDKVF